MHPGVSCPEVPSSQQQAADNRCIEPVPAWAKPNTLEPEHAAQILGWVQWFEDVPGHAKVITLESIAENDWNLNIPRYVEPLIEEETISVSEALINLKAALDEAFAAEEHLTFLLNDADYVENKNA